MQHHTYDYAQWKFDRARHIITQPIWGSHRGLALSAPCHVGARAGNLLPPKQEAQALARRSADFMLEKRARWRSTLSLVMIFQ